VLCAAQVRPLEEAFKFSSFFSSLLHESDFEAKPSVLLVGQYSTGKTTFIKVGVWGAVSVLLHLSFVNVIMYSTHKSFIQYFGAFLCKVVYACLLCAVSVYCCLSACPIAV
jgi:hypothetical protein